MCTVGVYGVCIHASPLHFYCVAFLQNSRRSSTTKLSPEYRLKEKICLKTAVLTDIDSTEG